MKVMANDLGICGTEQLFYAGSVAFDTDGADEGVTLCRVPHSAIVTRAVAIVKTAFNAGTTNVLTVGTNDGADNMLGTADITEGTAGAYSKLLFLEVANGAAVKAKFTQTGTAATAGMAEIYVFAAGTPE